ncbi:MAG TPA: Error-prone repair protein ImuA [Cytophagaceae bacterium]|jgi:protein ImuA
MLPQGKAHLFAELQASILRLQGFKTVSNPSVDVGLGEMHHAFPNKTFPLGCMHEFISENIEDTAATIGFVSGLLSLITKGGGTSLWISASGTPFPPAIKQFGLEPDRILFVDLKNEREVLEAMDEALKCPALNAVICEVKDLSFKNSRRLQLAVEESAVTGFILRHTTRISTTACVSRWRIRPLPSITIDSLPGVGFPAWKVELQKIRNGIPGSWNIQWREGKFIPAPQEPSILELRKRQVG